MLFNHFIFQGLSDTGELVVSKALNALTCLAELRLLKKPALQELVSEIVSFLCHPVSVIIFTTIQNILGAIFALGFYNSFVQL